MNRIIEKAIDIFLLLIALLVIFSILISYIPYARENFGVWFPVFLAGISIGIFLYIYDKITS